MLRLAVSLAVVLAPLVAVPAPAADARRPVRERDGGTSLVVRVGGGQLALAADDGTPLIGAWLHDAVTAYNGAAGAYNQAHGLSEGMPGAAPTRGHEALDLRADLMLVTPSLETGGRGYFFKLEAPLGFASDWQTYGLAVYPVNVAFGLGSDGIEGYLSAGAIVSYVTGVGEAQGGLVQGRLAAGVRVRTRDRWAITAEIGWGLFGVGGALDSTRLQQLEEYDPRTMAPPPPPGEVVRGGDQQGMVDLAVGVALP